MLGFTCCRKGSLFALLFFVLATPADIWTQQTSSMELRTSSFPAGGFIPKPFTCDAADKSPSISWTDPPKGTESFALIEDDPDAPSGTFVHWVVYDLPPDLRGLPESVPANDSRGHQGMNDFGRRGYNGPCPPPGRPHRYFIRLFALDVKLNLRPGASRRELEAAMKGHILARAEVMGRYGR